jgi:hypothetical protein
MRLPEPARSIARCTTECVAAAESGDREEFEQSAARLAALNPEQVGLVAGAVVRSLLEDVHPDGLSGDDVQAVLERCVRAAGLWLPRTDPGILAALLIGALGINQPVGVREPAGAHERDHGRDPDGAHEADGTHRPDGEPLLLSPTDVALHAPLLIADLLALSGRGLTRYLDAAFAEIARAETMELP